MYFLVRLHQSIQIPNYPSTIYSNKQFTNFTYHRVHKIPFQCQNYHMLYHSKYINCGTNYRGLFCNGNSESAFKSILPLYTSVRYNFNPMQAIFLKKESSPQAETVPVYNIPSLPTSHLPPAQTRSRLGNITMVRKES